MTVFVDTSALYAVLDRDDANHALARDLWARLLDQDTPLFTSNYVLIEVLALVQRRLGIDATRSLCDDVLPVIALEWVTPDVHTAALAAFLAAGRRDLSFVDCSSFQIMRRVSTREVFAFDPHFAEQGFELRS